MKNVHSIPEDFCDDKRVAWCLCEFDNASSEERRAREVVREETVLPSVELRRRVRRAVSGVVLLLLLLLFVNAGLQWFLRLHLVRVDDGLRCTNNWREPWWLW